MEKTKLRFDSEGIQFAFPQLDLHINHDGTQAWGSGCPAPGNVMGIRAHEAADEENI
jgi:hypothetical protein